MLSQCSLAQLRRLKALILLKRSSCGMRPQIAPSYARMLHLQHIHAHPHVHAHAHTCACPCTCACTYMRMSMHMSMLHMSISMTMACACTPYAVAPPAVRLVYTSAGAQDNGYTWRRLGALRLQLAQGHVAQPEARGGQRGGGGDGSGDAADGMKVEVALSPSQAPAALSATYEGASDAFEMVESPDWGDGPDSI